MNTQASANYSRYICNVHRTHTHIGFISFTKHTHTPPTVWLSPVLFIYFLFEGEKKFKYSSFTCVILRIIGWCCHRQPHTTINFTMRTAQFPISMHTQRDRAEVRLVKKLGRSSRRQHKSLCFALSTSIRCRPIQSKRTLHKSGIGFSCQHRMNEKNNWNLKPETHIDGIACVGS